MEEIKSVKGNKNKLYEFFYNNYKTGGNEQSLLTLLKKITKKRSLTEKTMWEPAKKIYNDNIENITYITLDVMPYYATYIQDTQSAEVQFFDAGHQTTAYVPLSRGVENIKMKYNPQILALLQTGPIYNIIEYSATQKNGFGEFPEIKKTLIRNNIKPFINKLGFYGNKKNKLAELTEIFKSKEEENHGYELQALEFSNIQVKRINKKTLLPADALAFKSQEIHGIVSNFTIYETIEEENGNIKIKPYEEAKIFKSACYYTSIVAALKESWNKYYKKQKLTVEFLYKFITNKEFSHNILNGATFKDFYTFFETYGIKAVLLDINLNIINEYVPENKNKHIKNFLPLIFSGYHIEPITHEERKLNKLIYSKHNNEINELYVNDEFFLLEKKDSEQLHFFCNTYNEIINIIHNNKNKIINIYTNEDLQNIFNDITANLKIIPFVSYAKSGFLGGGKITKLKFVNLNNSEISIFAPSNGKTFICEEYNDIKKIEAYRKMNEWIYSLYLNKTYISSYNETIKKFLFGDCYPAPLIENFVDEVGQTYQKFDFCKFYSSIFYEMEYIPKINNFDTFEKYTPCDGIKKNPWDKVKNKFDNLEDYSIYYIYDENEKYILTYGVNLKKKLLTNAENIKIHYVLKPSELIKNNTRPFIDTLYRSDLSTLEKKNIINSLIGMFGKKRNLRTKCVVANSSEEIHFLKRGGEKITLDDYLKNDDSTGEIVNIGDHFAIYQENEKALAEGFNLISLFIKDTANQKMQELAQELKECGYNLKRFHTDAIYCDINEEALNKFMNNYKNKYFRENNIFGNLKVETEGLDLEAENKNFKNEKIELPYINKKNILLKNEYDTEEIKKKLVPFTIITAETPGSGKSTALKSLESVLFVCPYNNLKNENIKDGIPSTTLHKLLGLRFSETIAPEPLDISEIKNIVFDEIFLYDLKTLWKIRQYIAEHKNISFFATGDVFQLCPITDELNLLSDEQKKEVYKKAVFSMFPNIMTLKFCKRGTTREKCQQMEELCELLKKATDKNHIYLIIKKFFGHNFIKDSKKIPDNIKKFICTTNAHCEFYNKLTEEKTKKGFDIGSIVLGRQTKYGDSPIYVNNSYEIIGKNVSKEIKIVSLKCCCSGEIITVIENSLLKLFKLPHAMTCHALQGLSINEPVCIVGLNEKMATREFLYTAITRVRNLNDIYFLI